MTQTYGAHVRACARMGRSPRARRGIRGMTSKLAPGRLERGRVLRALQESAVCVDASQGVLPSAQRSAARRSSARLWAHSLNAGRSLLRATQAGIECFRHYEIAARGALPLFLGTWPASAWRLAHAREPQICCSTTGAPSGRGRGSSCLTCWCVCASQRCKPVERPTQTMPGLLVTGHHPRELFPPWFVPAASLRPDRERAAGIVGPTPRATSWRRTTPTSIWRASQDCGTKVRHARNAASPHSPAERQADAGAVQHCTERRRSGSSTTHERTCRAARSVRRAIPRSARSCALCAARWPADYVLRVTNNSQAKNILFITHTSSAHSDYLRCGPAQPAGSTAGQRL